MTGRRSRAARVFSFPDPVDEVSARLVAGGVVLLSALALVTDWDWLVGLIALGFIARVLSGPTLSPLGQLMTRVVRPRLRIAPRYVAGPPKRFAQAIGAVFTTTAAVLALGFDERFVVQLLLACMIVAATLESVFAICLGCKAFAVLMRLGLVPDEVCERCNALRG
jgi:hypothetical protein